MKASQHAGKRQFEIPPQAWLGIEALFLLFLIWQLWDFEVLLFIVPVSGKLIFLLILALRSAEFYVREGKPSASPHLRRILGVLENTKVLYALLVICFFAYLLSKNVLFGYLVALSILLLVAEEIVRGVIDG